MASPTRALGRQNEVLAAYDEAIRLDPNDALAYNNRGLTYHALSRYTEALADYDAAIRRDPNLAKAYSNRGITYHALGRHAEALADSDAALRLDPNHAEAYANRGNTYYALGGHAEALADYDAALRINPNFVQVYSNRGVTCDALGRHAEALADHDAAIRRDPNLAKAYYNRGRTYGALGRHPEALADFDTALRIDPNYATAYANKGILHYNRAAWDEALQAFEAAARLGDSTGAQDAAQGASDQGTPSRPRPASHSAGSRPSRPSWRPTRPRPWVVRWSATRSWPGPTSSRPSNRLSPSRCRAPPPAGVPATARMAAPAHGPEGPIPERSPGRGQQHSLREYQGANVVPHEPRYRKGDEIGRRYLVHEALAGGMSEIYLCLDLKERTPCALKTFQARYLASPRARAYFEREAATWVALEKHPNVVRCFHMETVDNIPFLFLEWAAGTERTGTDLRDWLDRRGPLEPRRALEFTLDVCRALVHAQKKAPGFVHCDIKPENVLVAQGQLAKLTDFGLAKLVRDAGLVPLDEAAPAAGDRWQVSSAGGTPRYMAPEQWRGEPVDARTDVYAVGCLLYELLTGRWPFQAATINDLKRRHLESPPPPLGIGLRGSSGEGLDRLLARCLAKEMGERYPSASELIGAIAGLFNAWNWESPRGVPEAEDFTAGDYCNRGNTYRALARHADALADHDAAIRLDPNLAIACYNRGKTYQALARHAEAAAEYDAAIRLDRNYAPSHCQRGITYSALGRHAEALADYETAIGARSQRRDGLRQPRQHPPCPGPARRGAGRLRLRHRHRSQLRPGPHQTRHHLREVGLSRRGPGRLRRGHTNRSQLRPGPLESRNHLPCPGQAGSGAGRFRRGHPSRSQLRQCPLQPWPHPP